MNDLKKHIVLYISIAIIIISITFTVSYAFFTAVTSGNEGAKNTQVETGNLNIDFSTSKYINDSNLMLIKDTEKETKAPSTVFKVKHADNSTVATTYNLYLSDIVISDNFKSSDFKWELLKDGAIVNSGNYTTAVSGTDFLLTNTPVTLSLDTEDNWVFRTWLSETNEDQLSLTQGNFSARIKLVAIVGK